MVRVSIDVTALRDVIQGMRDVVDEVSEEWSAVGTAAAEALTSAPALQKLGDHTTAVTEAADDLQARLDLAILVNTGDDGKLPDSGTLTYELSGSSDSVDAVMEQLGVELAEVGRNVHPWLPDEYGDYADLMERYTNDGTVMSAMYQELGPQGTLALIAQFAEDDEGYGIDPADQERLLSAMQDGLETASNESGFPSDEFADGLVDAATQHPSDPDAPVNVAAFPGALSYLLYDSHYSDEFLTSAADALDEYERTNMEGTWSDRSMGSNIDFSRFFPDDATVAGWDPMVGLMSALGNNADVSLDFFTGGPNDGADRQMYWLHDRQWMHDQFLHVSEALLEATTDPSLLDPPDGQDAADASQLVSAAVNLLGHREGIGYYDAGMFGTDVERSAAASENFATMLATYMYAVDESLQLGEPHLPGWDEAVNSQNVRAGYYPGVIPNVPLFNEDSLRNFMVYSAGNEDGLLALRAGLNDYTAQKYSLAAQYLQESGVDDQVARDIFEQAYLGQAQLEGAFVNAIGDASVSRAAGEDAVREQWVSLGTDVIGLFPVSKLDRKSVV